MKTCPQCHKEYEDNMFFCLNDGTGLISLEDTLPSNPATFEETLAFPKAENTLDPPMTAENIIGFDVNGQETLNLPVTDRESLNNQSFEETLAFSNDNAFENTMASPQNAAFEDTLPSSNEGSFEDTMPFTPLPVVTQESIPADWQPADSIPQAVPSESVTGDFEKASPVNNVSDNRDAERKTAQSTGSGKGLFIALGGLIGLFLLTVSAIGGWFLFRSAPQDVAVANTDNRNVNLNIVSNENSNNSSGSANSDNSDFITDANTDTSDSNILSSPITNTNSSTPKSTPTPKTPTPTPTPKETPDSKTSVTPTPKTPTPIPGTPTPKPVPSTISGGVLNGKAVSLVKPPYPPAAKAVKASGQVVVQVTVDENGNVISASAVSGHALLRGAAESAARSSKFSPTMLSGQRVKVTGTIVYNFIAQ